MQKRKIKHYGSTFIRNANLIGAGNKFVALRNEQGEIQWRVSIAKQAGQKVTLSALKRKAEELSKTGNTPGNKPIQKSTMVISRR